MYALCSAGAAELTNDPSRDFVPVSSAIDTFGSIAVSGSLKVESLAELVKLARVQPGKLNWSSGGGAFPAPLAGFAKTAGLDVVQVSYREQNLAIQDLAARSLGSGISITRQSIQCS
jgi:tripartite-type tricarboxylate transporter receptor subunit TctC